MFLGMREKAGEVSLGPACESAREAATAAVAEPTSINDRATREVPKRAEVGSRRTLLASGSDSGCAAFVS